MNIKRLLYSKYSKFFISILLGLGLSTLFRKVCNERNCIKFLAPNFNDIKGKVFKQDDKCYEYKESQTSCQDNKKKVNFA